VRKLIAALVLAALSFVSPAWADNYSATAGSGLTFAAKSIGGVLYPWWIPTNSSGAELFTSGNAGYVQFPSAQAITCAACATQTTLVALGVSLGSPMQQSGGSVTANAGTNLNTNLLAISIDTTLGSPFQAGASIGNTVFGATESGPWSVTANAGTNLNTNLLAQSLNTTLGSPFQAGGSIGNTSFAATQGTSPWVTSDNGTKITAATMPSGGAGLTGWLSAIFNVLGNPFQAGGSIGNTGFSALQGGTANSATNPFYTQSVFSAASLGTINPTSLASWCLGTTSLTPPGCGQEIGGVASSTEPAKTTTGYLVAAFHDLVGKYVTSPFANRENYLQCAVAMTTSGATVCTGMGQQGANVKIYVTDVSCTRSDAGTTAASVSLNTSQNLIIDLPNTGGGGGYAKTYGVPLLMPANTSLEFQPLAPISTIHCHATGYSGY
jgi:hypothetical protein